MGDGPPTVVQSRIIEESVPASRGLYNSNDFRLRTVEAGQEPPSNRELNNGGEGVQLSAIFGQAARGPGHDGQGSPLAKIKPYWRTVHIPCSLTNDTFSVVLWQTIDSYVPLKCCGPIGHKMGTKE